jgi:hypothetical protein
MSGLRITTIALGVIQFLFGIVGFRGVYSYLVESLENPSRYQFLYIPAWMFIFSIPLLIASALAYRQCSREMFRAERVLLNIGFSLPLLALICAMLV